jgi:GNAT superfamily N-acetyltransferase
MEIIRYAERPDLREIRQEQLNTFPTYLNHNVMGARYWGRLYDEFPAFQLALVDDGELVAEVHALPVPVEGDVLPAGWDEAFERGMEAGGGTVLSLLAISVRPVRRGGGLATTMLEAARTAAGAAGLRSVIAPVRPTLKQRYPLIPIERYVEWRREDGSHFNPWIRVHERAGGTIVRPAPASMRIEAPVTDWEDWLGLSLPADGTYIHADMLAPLEVRNGVGVHVEPNVWLRHSVR